MQEGVPSISDDMVDRSITKKDLSRYCRRRTRGEEDTICLIERLLCIQDVPGVPLYTEVGTTTKSGVILTKYRCARGSTSQESFHCHLNRTSANALNFQLSLLEGLNRWNQDRGTAAVTSKPASLLTYSGDMAHSVNTNSLKVFGRAFIPTFRPPAQYTGELLGVDYLLSQTGQPMALNPDSEETEEMLEDVDEGGEEDEGFGEDEVYDITVPSLSNDPNFSISSHFLPSSQPIATTQAAVSSIHPAASTALETNSSIHPPASTALATTSSIHPPAFTDLAATSSIHPPASTTLTATSSAVSTGTS
ncbi:uncharacterized protein LOC130223503 [Danio aesculapii]|uniref:uncharacterized protein LOC130223503 n=1 Tax=Danio aesculapii TaxID=1142201 RepID=UPI0024BFB7B3|nr:uncharacterized protein LOC130223503 [Danio aesculapii]